MPWLPSLQVKSLQHLREMPQMSFRLSKQNSMIFSKREKLMRLCFYKLSNSNHLTVFVSFGLSFPKRRLADSPTSTWRRLKPSKMILKNHLLILSFKQFQEFKRPHNHQLSNQLALMPSSKMDTRLQDINRCTCHSTWWRTIRAVKRWLSSL